MCPSGRSVHPSVLVHEPSCFLCKTPVVPSNLRQRNVSSSDRAISTISPSAKAIRAELASHSRHRGFTRPVTAAIQTADKLADDQSERQWMNPERGASLFVMQFVRCLDSNFRFHQCDDDERRIGRFLDFAGNDRESGAKILDRFVLEMTFAF